MRRLNPWLRIGIDAWSLGLEASLVMAARSAKLIAGGSAAQAELNRMLSEKLAAGMTLQIKAMSGGLGPTPQDAASKTLRHYRARVRKNTRRLYR